MFESFRVKTHFMGQKEKQPLPTPKGRKVVSFADLKRRIDAMPWEAAVRDIVLERTGKYPEASLDFVWKNLEDFRVQAVRQIADQNRATVPPAPAQTAEPAPVVKPEAVEKPKLTRPSFFDEPPETPEVSV